MFRIINIEGCRGCKSVFIGLFREDNIDYVKISAWHDGDFFQSEDVNFDSLTLAKRYVCDFSEASANEFANSFIA